MASVAMGWQSRYERTCRIGTGRLIQIQVPLFVVVIMMKTLQNLLRVSGSALRFLTWTWLNGKMTAPRLSFTAPPIQFTMSTLRLMLRIPMAMMMMMMSFPTLRHGTASDPALPRSKALVPTWRQDAATSRELRTFSVIEIFTGFLVRNILMVRSITWWIGFQPWCEAVYCTRPTRSL
jgi:hypothetical protein